MCKEVGMCGNHILNDDLAEIQSIQVFVVLHAKINELVKFIEIRKERCEIRVDFKILPY